MLRVIITVVVGCSGLIVGGPGMCSQLYIICCFVRLVKGADTMTSGVWLCIVGPIKRLISFEQENIYINLNISS